METYLDEMKVDNNPNRRENTKQLRNALCWLYNKYRDKTIEFNFYRGLYAAGLINSRQHAELLFEE